MNKRKIKKKAKKFLKNQGFNKRCLKLQFVEMRFSFDIDSTSSYTFEKNTACFVCHEFRNYGGHKTNKNE